MVVLVKSGDGGLVALQPSLADRARARMLAGRYDRRLAMGVPPEQDVGLAVRAQALVRLETRRWLARSLRRLLQEARRPDPLRRSPLSLESRRRLLQSGPVVARLIDELQRPAPLSSRGVAALCVLLRDGNGPLYGRGSVIELCERLGEVRRDLVPLTIWQS